MRDHTLADSNSGASAVEYGLLIAGIGAMIVIVIFLFGGSVTGIFSDTCDSIGDAANNGASC